MKGNRSCHRETKEIVLQEKSAPQKLTQRDEGALERSIGGDAVYTNTIIPSIPCLFLPCPDIEDRLRMSENSGVPVLFFSGGSAVPFAQTAKNHRKQLLSVVFGTPGWIRTSGLQSRSFQAHPDKMLYFQRLYGFRRKHPIPLNFPETIENTRRTGFSCFAEDSSQTVVTLCR